MRGARAAHCGGKGERTEDSYPGHRGFLPTRERGCAVHARNWAPEPRPLAAPPQRSTWYRVWGHQAGTQSGTLTSSCKGASSRARRHPRGVDTPESAGTKGRLDGGGRPGRVQTWTPARGSCQPGGTARPRDVAAGAVSGRTGVRGPLGDVVREGQQLLCDGRAGHCCHLRH